MSWNVESHPWSVHFSVVNSVHIPFYFFHEAGAWTTLVEYVVMLNVRDPDGAQDIHNLKVQN